MMASILKEEVVYEIRDNYITESNIELMEAHSSTMRSLISPPPVQSWIFVTYTYFGDVCSRI